MIHIRPSRLKLAGQAAYVLLSVHAIAQTPIEFEGAIEMIFEAHCVSCHQDDGRAPFSLEGYKSVISRIDAIGKVLEARKMPPWLAEPGFGDFQRAHRLSDEDRSTILKWITQGAPSGSIADDNEPMPAPPANEDRHPDLVLRPTEPYDLPAEGSPFFRSFVLPLNLEEPKHVSAIALRPGTALAIGHATIRQDPAGFARTLDEMDREPGFAGVETRLTGGDCLISWFPSEPRRELALFAWTLYPTSELVVDLYLIPTGKPEQITFELTLEFQDEAPAASTVMLHPSATDIDIPANEAQHVVQRKMSLENPSKVVSVLPTAGPLCREIKIFALIRGTSPAPLVWIKDWDPQWQREYHFTEPVMLPADSEIVAEFTFDNTPQNPRNPNNPPVPVRWGLEKGTERAEFWITLIPSDESNVNEMRQEYGELELEMLIRGYASLAESDPDNFEANARLGHVLTGQNRTQEALPFLEAAHSIQPNSWNVNHNLGLALVSDGKIEEASRSFKAALGTRPDYAPSRKGLALSLALRGAFEEAVTEFEGYLSARPGDYETRNNFGVVLAKLKRIDEAEQAYRAALNSGGASSGAHGNLASLLAATGRASEAEALLEGAIPIVPAPTAQQLRLLLAKLLASSARFDEARNMLNTVLELNPENADAKAGIEALESLNADDGGQP